MKRIVKLAASISPMLKAKSHQYLSHTGSSPYANLVNTPEGRRKVLDHAEFINFVAKKKAESLSELASTLRNSKTISRTPENAHIFDAAMLKYKNDMSDLARLGNHLASKGRIDKDYMKSGYGMGNGKRLDFLNNQYLKDSGNFGSNIDAAIKFRRTADLSAALNGRVKPEISNNLFADRLMMRSERV